MLLLLCLSVFPTFFCMLTICMFGNLRFPTSAATFNFLLVCCEFHFMYPVLLTLQSPCTTLEPCNLPTKRRRKELAKAHCGSYSVSLLSALRCLQMFFALTHWSGLRPLASANLSILGSHWDSSWLSCCFSELQQFMFRWANSKLWIWAGEVSRDAQLADSHTFRAGSPATTATRASSTLLPR